jgi:hypothetical protein
LSEKGRRVETKCGAFWKRHGSRPDAATLQQAAI